MSTRRGDGKANSTCRATDQTDRRAMAPIHPSRTGEAGFTLTELLVVLAIIGLLMVAVPVLVQSAMPGTRSLAATRALADDLRIARGEAIERGAATAIRFDTVK